MMNKIKFYFAKFWIEISILIFFAAIYSSISLINHYNFRTFGFDLGIYNNAIYDYAHFRFNQTTVMDAVYNGNILGDHFELYLIILAPFSYIFGSYTLLIFQILAILFGGIGVYFVIFHISKKKWYANLAMFHFFSIWGIYSALSFDYHNNVVAAMLVPWLYYFIITNKFKSAYIFLGFILIGKENMSLWIIFILIGSIFMFYKDAKKRKFLIISSLISMLYFILAVNLFIPYFTTAGRGNYYYVNQYALLGKSFSEIIINIINNPRYAFSLLFENTMFDYNYSGIKAELFFVIIFSGGFALLYKPQFLFMLIPIFAQKLFNTDYPKWGINNHYSIEFVPIITMAVFIFFNEKFQKKNFLIIFSFLVVTSTIYVTISTLNFRYSKWYNPVLSQFYKSSHYNKDYCVSNVHKFFSKIPSNAVVSAQNPFVSHLAMRDKIYQFPVVNEAEYIILGEDNFYPMDSTAYKFYLNYLKQNENWSLISSLEKVFIFKKVDLHKPFSLPNQINMYSSTTFPFNFSYINDKYVEIIDNNNGNIEYRIRKNAERQTLFLKKELIKLKPNESYILSFEAIGNATIQIDLYPDINHWFSTQAQPKSFYKFEFLIKNAHPNSGLRIFTDSELPMNDDVVIKNIQIQCISCKN